MSLGRIIFLRMVHYSDIGLKSGHGWRLGDGAGIVCCHAFVVHDDPLLSSLPIDL